MLKKVIITVDEHADTTTDYINFEGSSCLSTSKQFHALLAQFGVRTEQTSMTPKPELLAALEITPDVVSLSDTIQNEGTEGS